MRHPASPVALDLSGSRAPTGQDQVDATERLPAGEGARFSRRLSAEGPYFFPDLADTSEAEERAAIDAGQIRAGGIRYAATRA